MPRLFGRKNEDAADAMPPEDDRASRRPIGTYAPYVPASVRQPELQRFAVYEDGDPDAPDEDIDFLNALASTIDTSTAASPKRRDARDLTQNEKMIDRKPDGLQVFRDVAPEADTRTPVSHVIAVRDVEIGDLLDDLQTTAAALRRKKAA